MRTSTTRGLETQHLPNNGIVFVNVHVHLFSTTDLPHGIVQKTLALAVEPQRHCMWRRFTRLAMHKIKLCCHHHIFVCTQGTSHVHGFVECFLEMHIHKPKEFTHKLCIILLNDAPCNPGMFSVSRTHHELNWLSNHNTMTTND